MGYTHYWRTSTNGIPKNQWKAICEDVIALITNLPEHSTSAGGYHATDPLEIAWEHDKPNRPPEISSEVIRFNGKDGENDLGHETFYFERHPKKEEWERGDDPSVFAFCKTAGKPYDLIVCGALIVAAKHASEYVKVSSDGEVSDWKPALKWVKSVLGQDYDIPLAEDKTHAM